MLIADKTPLDFKDQLESWNYLYDEKTNKFFKFIGLGILVLYNNWNLAFVVRGINGKLLTHDSKKITKCLKEIAWAEAEVFKAYLQLNDPLMLNNLSL